MKDEREMARREQHYKVLQHQVNQIQLDFEHTRAGVTTTGKPARVMDRELHMARLEDNDDIEHYLTTYERLAEVYKWPEEDWAIRLIPLLTGKAQSAFVSMEPILTRDYKVVKQAILAKYEIHSETYRLRFRARETLVEETPRELYVRLKDLFGKWVKIGSCNKDVIYGDSGVGTILTSTLPRSKDKERNPSTAAEAATLVEAYIATRKGPGNYRYAGILHPV